MKDRQPEKSDTQLRTRLYAKIYARLSGQLYAQIDAKLHGQLYDQLNSWMDWNGDHFDQFNQLREDLR